MINKTRLRQAIAVMKRASRVKMKGWQSGDTTVNTEKEAHTCGNSACFAGWLALSPEFQNSGGSVFTLSGAPIYQNHCGSEAIIKWMGATDAEALTLNLIINGGLFVTPKEAESIRIPYLKEDKLEYVHIFNWAQWTAKDVIKALETLL